MTATPDHINFLRQRFNHLTFQYHLNPFTRWVGHSELSVLREMIPTAPRPGETRALDFGCGTGRVATLLLELGYRVTAYDISPRMLDQARINIGKRPDVFFTSDPNEISAPWPLIVSLGVLDYYPDKTAILTDWRQLLLHNGQLIATVPNASSPFGWVYTSLSRFTCQAYSTSAEKLSPAIWSSGLLLSNIQFAFPHRWWGHTIVLAFRTQ